MAERLVIIDTEEHSEVGDAHRVGQDVDFPDFVDDWTDVMDARHPPYTDQTIDELCHFAHHVRKPYILVDASQLEDDAP